MSNITASEPRAHLNRLIHESAESHQPVFISGKHNNAVRVGEEGRETIQETLFLRSLPGMQDSIREGMNTPVDECDEGLQS